jgi:hypothetical protein
VARALTALVALCALALPACGKSDKDQVDQTVRDFVTSTNNHDAKLCDKLLSQQFLEESTGANGSKARDVCKQQLKSAKLKLKLDKIASTKVTGNTAQVRAVLIVQGQSQDQILRLKKESGDWKLSGGSAG